MEAARFVVGDDDGFGEDAAGLAVAPGGVEEVDVEGEDHAGLELVTDGTQRLLVRLGGVVAEARILQRAQAVAVDPGLAHA